MGHTISYSDPVLTLILNKLYVICNSFLDEDGQLLVEPPKETAMDSNNKSSNSSKSEGCPNPCASSSTPQQVSPPMCPSSCTNNPPQQVSPQVCSNPCGNNQSSPASGNNSCPNPCSNNPPQQVSPPLCPNPCDNNQSSTASGNNSCSSPQQSCGGGCSMPTSGCISKSSLLNFESDFQQTIPLSSR